jgi:hypothetical protein
MVPTGMWTPKDSRLTDFTKLLAQNRRFLILCGTLRQLGNQCLGFFPIRAEDGSDEEKLLTAEQHSDDPDQDNESDGFFLFWVSFFVLFAFVCRAELKQQHRRFKFGQFWLRRLVL